MKRLILLRHAKAAKGDPADDFGRQLAKDGRREMTAMARKLAAGDGKPDLALVSPAARTRETWSLAGLDGVPVRFEDAIYEAAPEDLMALVHSVPDEVGTLLMVGHNPGLEELAGQLAGDGREGGEAALDSGLPTAAMAVLDFAVERWSAVAPGGGRLVRLDTP